jgi:hypothetical protein
VKLVAISMITHTIYQIFAMMQYIARAITSEDAISNQINAAAIVVMVVTAAFEIGSINTPGASIDDNPSVPKNSAQGTSRCVDNKRLR